MWIQPTSILECGKQPSLGILKIWTYIRSIICIMANPNSGTQSHQNIPVVSNAWPTAFFQEWKKTVQPFCAIKCVWYLPMCWGKTQYLTTKSSNAKANLWLHFHAVTTAVLIQASTLPNLQILLLQGTIHILRKHLLSTKLNLTYFFFKNCIFFCQNKRIYFSISHFDHNFMLKFEIFSK